MGATYTRQSTYADGDTINADDTNDEFDQLLAAFAASSGHTHDGTTAEGGPVTKLLGNTLTFGAATAGTDITITFDGETNDGVFKWMEDEDYFEFSDDILIATTEKIQFRDTAIYINSSADGQLDLVADTEIQIAATTVDINGNVDVSGTLAVAGVLTGASLDISGDIDIDGTTNLDVVDIDGAVDMASTLAVAGVLTGASLDISGDIDIDGITNLDAVDIDGAVQLDATLTVGANDQGYDVILYGDTASANLTWDTSADDLILNGAAGLIVPDGQLTLGSTAVTSTAAELNLLDTAAANSVVNSKAVIYGSSGEVAGTLSTAAQANVTSLGTLTALTVDDVAVDGKVITMTGSASDTAVITAGADGTLSIVTTDAAAAAANIQITADGTAELAGTTVTLDSSGGITLDADGGTITFADAGASLGTITSSGYSGTSAVATTVTITDNESTNENNTVVFVAGADADGGNVGLESDGNLTYNPSTGTLSATNISVSGTLSTVDSVTMSANNAVVFEGATADAHETTLTVVDATADRTITLPNVSGTVPVLAAASNTQVTSTPEEINLIDGGTARGTTAVASGDGILINDAGTMVMTNVDTVSTYFAGHSVGGSNIVTTGALNSGSITSGFGTIDNGASAITTTGVITGGTLEATTDTAAGDNAAIGYTAAEGLILTGQGSTSDITLKNDADAVVFTVPTGTDDILFPDNAKAMFGAGSDLQIYHDGSNSYIKDGGTGDLKLQGNDFTIGNTADTKYFTATNGGGVELYHQGNEKLATTSTGIDVTGNVIASGTVEPAGDTAAGDNAAIGYTAAEGLILTGQGSTSDITLKNDADAVVFTVPTGTDDILFPDNAKAMFGAGSDLVVWHNGSNSYIQNSTGNLNIQAKNGESSIVAVPDDKVTLYHNNLPKIATTATGVTVTGTAVATTDTDTSNTGSVTLDFAANQNFVLTLTGNVTLANPTTEQVGQTGFITLIQDGPGGRTLSLGTDYETAGGAGITLTGTASATDIVPYVVAAAGRILLGSPQLAFS